MYNFLISNMQLIDSICYFGDNFILLNGGTPLISAFNVQIISHMSGFALNNAFLVDSINKRISLLTYRTNQISLLYQCIFLKRNKLKSLEENTALISETKSKKVLENSTKILIKLKYTCMYTTL